MGAVLRKRALPMSKRWIFTRHFCSLARQSTGIDRVSGERSGDLFPGGIPCLHPWNKIFGFQSLLWKRHRTDGAQSSLGFERWLSNAGGNAGLAVPAIRGG